MKNSNRPIKNKNIPKNMTRNSFTICKSKEKKQTQRIPRSIPREYMLTSCSLFKCESSERKKENNIFPELSNHSIKPPSSHCSLPDGYNQSKKVIEMNTLHNINPSIIKLKSSHNTNRGIEAHCIVTNTEIKKPEINLLKSLVSTCKILPSEHAPLSNLGNQNRARNYEACSKLSPNKKEKLMSVNIGGSPNNKQKLNNETVLDSENIFYIKTRDSKTIIAQAYKLNNSRFLFEIKPDRQLYFIGVIELELLHGSVEILGYNMDKTQYKKLAYSLQGSCHLGLKANGVDTRTECETNLRGTLFKKLISCGLPVKTATKLHKESGKNVLLIISKKKADISSTVWPIFLENNLSYYLFPPVDLLRQETRQCHSIEHSIDCIFEESLQDLGFKQFHEISEWFLLEKDILSEDADVTKTILCGGKSVGKSTLLRYLVNKCLQRWQRVLVIDCDLGQCEFTLPGCISVTLVEQPLLGPNYSHLKEPLRSVYLGEVDVTKCPESYSDGCCMLVKYAEEHHKAVPWIVNTMGFTKGFGVTLTCGIIKTVSPTHVVQIDSKDRKLNFPSRLEPEFVFCQDTKSFSVRNSLDYKLLMMPSGSKLSIQKTRGLSSAESRNLVILSYLSGMLSSEISNLSQVTPYMINMDMLILQTTTKYNLTKTEIAATMNGNLVALCSSTEGDLFPNCLGFGVVRAIDWTANTMFLITPLPAGALSKVNCLVKGTTALPESLYFNQGEVKGRMPYLAQTSGGATARFAKRDFRSFPASAQTAGKYRSSRV